LNREKLLCALQQGGAKSEPEASGEAALERSASAPPGNPATHPPENTLAVPAKSEGGIPTGRSGDGASGANSKDGVSGANGGSREASAPGSGTEESETDSDDMGAGEFHKQRFMKLEGLAQAVPPAAGGGGGEAGDALPIGPSVSEPRSLASALAPKPLLSCPLLTDKLAFGKF